MLATDEKQIAPCVRVSFEGTDQALVVETARADDCRRGTLSVQACVRFARIDNTERNVRLVQFPEDG